MKYVLMSVAVLLFLSGCVSTNMGKARYPTAPADFVAREEYPVGMESAWRAVEAVLDQERIPIVQSDRTGGRMTTEYVRGEAKMIVGIMGAASFTTRYRYTISLARVSGGTTRIRLFATLESSEDGQGQWLNITQSKPEDVKTVENWLAHKIATRLTPA